MAKFSAKPYATYGTAKLSEIAGAFGFEVRSGAAGQLRLFRDGAQYSRESAASLIRSRNYHAKSGAFYSRSHVNALLSVLEAKVPLKEWGYTGTFFSIIIPAGVTGPLERLKLLNAHSSLIINAMNADLAGALSAIGKELGDLAYQHVTRTVYNVPVQVVHYGVAADGTKTALPRFFKERTDNLRNMVRQSIYFDIRGARAELKIDFNEFAAPHWVWVEKGHRVVLPGGVETGAFVMPRPFVESLFALLRDYVSSTMAVVLTDYGIATTTAIGEWLLGERATSLWPRHIQSRPSREAQAVFRANRITPDLNVGFGLSLQ